MSSAIRLFFQAGNCSLLLRNHIKPFCLVRQQNLRHLLRAPKYGPTNAKRNTSIHQPPSNPLAALRPLIKPLFFTVTVSEWLKGSSNYVRMPCLMTLFVFHHLLHIHTSQFTGTCYLAATIAKYENSKSKRWFPMERSVFYSQKAGKFRDTLNKWNNSLSLSDKVVASIIVINALVFICWRIVPQSQSMARLFMNSVENLNGPRSQGKSRILHW